MIKRCEKCPINDMNKRLEDIETLDLMKSWFKNVCSRCRRTNRVAKGLCDNSDHSDIINNMSSVLGDKDGRVYDKRNLEILEKNISIIFKKEHEKTD
jgi:hypothetical protein